MDFDVTEPLYVRISQTLDDDSEQFCPDGVRVYMNDKTDIFPEGNYRR